MNLLEIAKKTLIQKVEQRELDNGAWEEKQYTGTLYEEIKDVFDDETEITFNTSFKAMRKVKELTNKTVKLDSEIGLVGLKIQSLINRLKIITDVKQHEHVTEQLGELAVIKTKLEADKSENEMNQIFDTIECLDIKITGSNICQDRDSFEELDTYVLNQIIVLVTNFLHKKDRIVPLKK